MEDLTSLIPVIKRARGYRLYSISGRRYLDLSLSGGYNLLGHRPTSFINGLKQVCEKGLLSDLPSIYGRRLVKALRGFFPDYHSFYAAASVTELLSVAGAALGRPLTAADIHDPLRESHSSAPISVWRPFFSGNVLSDMILPVLPTGMGPALFVLCAKQAAPSETGQIPVLSPLVLSAVLQSLRLLKSLTLPEYYRPHLPGSPALFIQKDIYLVPRCSEAEYRGVFTRFLDAGVVLSPRYAAPSILPFELSPGELQNLLRLFDNQKEGTT